MADTVTIIVKDSVAGKDFTLGKGENEVAIDLAEMLVRSGLAEYVSGAPKTGKPHEKAQKAVSPAASKAEKR